MGIKLKMITIVTLSLAACMDGASSSKEQAAPPQQLILTSAAGTRFAGPAARLDIRHTGAAQPSVELLMSGVDGTNRTWALSAVLSADSLTSRTLRAAVVERPLQAGDATVQLAAPGVDTISGKTGQLAARFAAGRIQGELKGASADLSVTFAGPIEVTCAAPAADAPVGSGGPSLVVDEKFATAACKPYAGLGRAP